MFQGGDITLNNGDGGESIYGEPFKDEYIELYGSSLRRTEGGQVLPP